MKWYEWVSNTLCWEKGARYQELVNILFHFYLINEKAKLIYSDREQSRGLTWGRLTVIAYRKMFWGVENSLFLSWGDGYNVDVCIYQNSLNCILKVEVFYFM